MTKSSDPIFTIINSVVTSRSTMNNHPSLLSLLLVFLLAVSLPPAAAMGMRLNSIVGSPSWYIQCVDGIVYAANSTFEANRRRLAGHLLAETAAGDGPDYTERAVGYWPSRAQASFWCTRRGVDGAGFCAACLAGAFLELERACPYHKEASFYNGFNCTLELGEYHILGVPFVYGEEGILKQAMASGLVFQAIGFAWLFFLLLREWRGRKRGTMMQSTSLSSGESNVRNLDDAI